MYNSTTKEPFNTKTITATVITITEMMKGGEEKVGHILIFRLVDFRTNSRYCILVT